MNIFVVSAAICRTIHHILPDIAQINLRKKSHTAVSYSKQGGGVIDVTCKVAFKLLYGTSAVSLFTHLPTPVPLTAAPLLSQSCSHACFAFFPQFSRKRETACSLHTREYLPHPRPHPPYPEAALFTNVVYLRIV